jgi:hypothetical protein
MALLHAVLDVVQHEFAKKEPKWTTRPHITPDDIEFLETECATASAFDPFGWRREMYQKYKKGVVDAVVRECEYGRVIALGNEAIPWGLWGRILRLYAPKNKKARVFLLASPHTRTVETQASPHPSSRQPKKVIGPANINGGYTYTCNNQTIMIYRAEDATRVLIHELQHASCLDHPEEGVDLVEAETEAWAELLYVALLSQGKPAAFQQLLQKQVKWMLAQNTVVREYIHRPHQFPWRYTVGKEDVWRRWGIITHDMENTAVQYELRRNAPPGTLLPTRSLRLTVPPTAALRQAFHVGNSNVL